jgi:hypothetical protein
MRRVAIALASIAREGWGDFLEFDFPVVMQEI